MTKQTPFSAFLNDTLSTRSITPEELARELGFAQPTVVKGWREARHIAPLDQLAPLSRVFLCQRTQRTIGASEHVASIMARLKEHGLNRRVDRNRHGAFDNECQREILRVSRSPPRR